MLLQTGGESSSKVWHFYGFELIPGPQSPGLSTENERSKRNVFMVERFCSHCLSWTVW